MGLRKPEKSFSHFYIFLFFCFPHFAYAECGTRDFNNFSRSINFFPTSAFRRRNAKGGNNKIQTFLTFYSRILVSCLDLSRLFMLDLRSRSIFPLRFGLFNLFEFIKFLPFSLAFLLHMNIFSANFSCSSSRFLWVSKIPTDRF